MIKTTQEYIDFLRKPGIQWTEDLVQIFKKYEKERHFTDLSYVQEIFTVSMSAPITSRDLFCIKLVTTDFRGEKFSEEIIHILLSDFVDYIIFSNWWTSVSDFLYYDEMLEYILRDCFKINKFLYYRACLENDIPTVIITSPTSYSPIHIPLEELTNKIRNLVLLNL